MPQPIRYEFSIPIRVAWGDMDALRHVNNVSYTRYFETARAEFFIHLRERFGHKPRENQILILTKLDFNYRGQVFFPATLDVTCGIPKLTGRTLLLGCSMWNEAGQCVADGVSHHMWVDTESSKAIRMPAEFEPVYAAYRNGELR